MINAVKVIHADGERWVTDGSSISTYNRREAVLEVAEALSPADELRVGNAYLSGKTSPSTSVQAEPVAGSVPGVDFQVGDQVTVDGAKQRCVDIRQSLNRSNGEWLPPVPTFSSRWEQKRLDADRAFDRLIALQGGGGVDAAASMGTEDLRIEEVRPSKTLQWSWHDFADPGDRELLDDDSRWQVTRIEEPCRAALIWCEPDFTGATGNTTFELHRNGSLWNGLFNVVIPPAPVSGVPFAAVRMWGYEFLMPEDTLTIRCIQNGQHRQGSYQIFLYPPV